MKHGISPKFQIQPGIIIHWSHFVEKCPILVFCQTIRFRDVYEGKGQLNSFLFEVISYLNLFLCVIGIQTLSQYICTEFYPCLELYLILAEFSLIFGNEYFRVNTAFYNGVYVLPRTTNSYSVYLSDHIRMYDMVDIYLHKDPTDQRFRLFSLETQSTGKYLGLFGYFHSFHKTSSQLLNSIYSTMPKTTMPNIHTQRNFVDFSLRLVHRRHLLFDN